MEKRSLVLIVALSFAVVFSMASNCPAPFCGDGILQPDYGEVCDPGGLDWLGYPPPDDAACPGQCLPDCTCPETPTITPATYSPTECQEVVTECPAIPTQCSVGAATLTGCPVVPTECMVVETECPATVTTCVDDPTYCPMLSTCGGEGCTPGYWKQPHHFDSWPAAYTPEMLFVDAFGVDAFSGMSLLEVLEQGGGGLIALGRHAVAALLNAASPDVDYDLLPGVVVTKFQEAYASGMYFSTKNLFEDLNEQYCPLN